MRIEDYSSGSETYIDPWYQRAKGKLIYIGQCAILIALLVLMIFACLLFCIFADFVDMVGNKVFRRGESS